MIQSIILNKRLTDYNVVGYMIRYALNMSSWLILVCSIFMMSQLCTVYTILELSVDYAINLDRQFVFMMPLIFSGSGYLIALCLVFPSWCSVLMDIRDFNRALESDTSADKWMREHLNPDSVCLDYLIFAKNHNLLTTNEFAMQINHYIKSAHRIISSEFITFIELQQELKLSNEQLLTIKQKFVNNPNGILTTSQLKFLSQHAILTNMELNIISQHLRLSRYSAPCITLLKAMVFGIMVGVIIIGLDYLTPALAKSF